MEDLKRAQVALGVCRGVLCDAESTLSDAAARVSHHAALFRDPWHDGVRSQQIKMLKQVLSRCYLHNIMEYIFFVLLAMLCNAIRPGAGNMLDICS